MNEKVFEYNYKQEIINLKNYVDVLEKQNVILKEQIKLLDEKLFELPIVCENSFNKIKHLERHIKILENKLYKPT